MIRTGLLRLHVAVAALFAVALTLAGPAGAQPVIDEWSTAKAPPPPALKPATIDPATTAYLVLDILKQNCAPRPRCMASVPHIKTLLDKARANNMMVVYSGFPATNPGVDTLPDIKPLGIEPTVVTIGDKFINTNLDGILKSRGIKTLLIAGSSSTNAVMLTTIDAALHGYSVVVPVDCMSGADEYADQYVTVELSGTLGVSEHVTLTSADQVTF
jgi:nicotinamidase-related amidase